MLGARDTEMKALVNVLWTAWLREKKDNQKPKYIIKSPIIEYKKGSMVVQKRFPKA